MIYLSYNDQSLFALYNGVMIRCIEIPDTWLLIQDIINRAMATISVEQQQAHFYPEYRRICWYRKIPYTEQDWSDLLRHGIIQD